MPNDKTNNPCPLCKSDKIVDKGWGLMCNSCGLWLGDSSLVDKFGGYKKLWNNTKESPDAD